MPIGTEVQKPHKQTKPPGMPHTTGRSVHHHDERDRPAHQKRHEPHDDGQ